MRRVRMALGLASLCAFLLTAVVPASAHQFKASRAPVACSESTLCKTHGVSIESEGHEGERNQKFVFGPFEIVCAAVAKANTQAEGAIAWSTNSTLSTEVKFTKCLTKAHFGSFVAGLHTAFNVEEGKSQPVKFVYHVNGFAEIGTGETVTEVEVGSGESTFKISGKVCKISWPAQTVPTAAIKKPAGEFSSAVYSNNLVPVEPTPGNAKKFPSGFQERLIVTNNFKSMEWHFEEGQCLGEGGFEEEAKVTEGKTAKYEGAVEQQVLGGNLGFE
jgi:hypothetical protein